MSTNRRKLHQGHHGLLFGINYGSVGTAPITEDPRFTFDTLSHRGYSLVIVGLGLFAIPEIVGLLDNKGAIAKSLKNEQGWFKGVSDVVKNWWLVIRCSTLGCIVGVPGWEAL